LLADMATGAPDVKDIGLCRHLVQYDPVSTPRGRVVRVPGLDSRANDSNSTTRSTSDATRRLTTTLPPPPRT
jgi:hypothetical protein